MTCSHAATTPAAPPAPAAAGVPVPDPPPPPPPPAAAIPYIGNACSSVNCNSMSCFKCYSLGNNPKENVLGGSQAYEGNKTERQLDADTKDGRSPSHQVVSPELCALTKNLDI